MTLFDGLRRLFGSRDDGEDTGGDDGGMVSCVEVKERLFEYLDGELANLSHEEVKRHIELEQNGKGNIVFDLVPC